MFTGIVEELGIIRKISISGHSGSITIEASKVLEGTRIGDSIAVNGICLTVTSMASDSFTADIMAETVRRSSLKGAVSGDKVNLERAMAADGRFGGHIVSGHVDGTGTIINMHREENAVWVTISAEPSIMKFIVEKGSVCLDGISLTVAKVGATDFSVSVIPHTGEETTLLRKKVGSPINIENDVVGKYVERLLNFKNNESTGITMDFLKKYDF
jgi:riboflavin synthase